MSYNKKNYKQKPAPKAKRESGDILVKEERANFPLVGGNFKIMIAAATMIVIGFLLMLGPGSTTEHFNPDIFSTRRIIIGPTIAFLGFVAMAAGIIWQPSHRDKIKALWTKLRKKGK